MNNTILNHQEIEHRIKRIAYQIYETNVSEKKIIIAGIVGGGLNFAKKLQAAGFYHSLDMRPQDHPGGKLQGKSTSERCILVLCIDKAELVDDWHDDGRS